MEATHLDQRDPPFLKSATKLIAENECAFRALDTQAFKTLQKRLQIMRKLFII